MKAILWLMLFAPAAFAETPDLCAGAYCSPAMNEMMQGFSAAGEVDRRPFVASGICYHGSDDLDPGRAHHGVLLIDQKEGEYFLGGSFGFFYDEDPYQEWTVETAREKLGDIYLPNHHLLFETDFAFADMNPEKTPLWKYWLRQSGRALFVLGYWSEDHRLLCRMEIH